MYAEPEFVPLSSSRYAPTMATSFPGAPLIETDQPNQSFAAPSEARSFCSSTQIAPLLR